MLSDSQTHFIEVAKARALELKDHHLNLNASIGRDPKRSHTLELTAEILDALRKALNAS
jgi:hypothetical protein